MEGGAATTEYAVDGAAWATGTTVKVTGDGVHTVSYRSIDNAGNVEADKSVQVKIDGTAPVTSVTGADDLWHQSPVALTLAATDASPGSGMNGGPCDDRVPARRRLLDERHGPRGRRPRRPCRRVPLGRRRRQRRGRQDSATVKIDTQAPVTTQAGADGAWHASPVDRHLHTRRRDRLRHDRWPGPHRVHRRRRPR